jgi:hypothetical protein
MKESCCGNQTVDHRKFNPAGFGFAEQFSPKTGNLPFHRKDPVFEAFGQIFFDPVLINLFPALVGKFRNAFVKIS